MSINWRMVKATQSLTTLISPLEFLQKRIIFKSLPNTRLESKTDSMAYSRVSTHLMAFKKAVIDQVHLKYDL